jgi:putative peptide maturation dehydrogenase
MARVRRTHYLAVSRQDDPLPDIAALLRGVGRLAHVPTTYAISILRGAEYPLSPDELALLLSVPSDRWVHSDGMDGGVLSRLAHMGLVLMDSQDELLEELVHRDRELALNQWNLYGALYHFMTKWRDVDLRVELADDAEGGELPPPILEAIDRFAARHGPPPPAFHSLGRPRAVHELPLVEREGGLYEALARRKTTRGFDRGATMTTEELATVLYYAFGCHGYAGMAGNDELMIKRTSPSGGGLHPIEVYPLVAGVEGIEPGLYHYNARDHSLELISELASAELGEAANEFVCGQSYFASAQVLFAMTARFYRSFWKYRRYPKQYSVLMMDAAHLSQTLYLVSAELGLGAFVTVAVNGANIEERLGIDGGTEGVLAVSGCGRPARARSPLEPQFARYVPRETEVPTTGHPVTPRGGTG